MCSGLSCVILQALLLLGGHLRNALHEVLVRDLGGLPAQREHAGLSAHSLTRTVED